MSDELLVKRLGIAPYPEAWELQKELAEQRRRQEIPDTLLLTPTFTRGRRSKPEEHPTGIEW